MNNHAHNRIGLQMLKLFCPQILEIKAEARLRRFLLSVLYLIYTTPCQGLSFCSQLSFSASSSPMPLMFPVVAVVSPPSGFRCLAVSRHLLMAGGQTISPK